MAIKTIPSLVIGLGGTGKRALTHLKRRIYDTYGRADLPWIRLLSIDTDSATVNNPPVISQRTGEYITLGTSEMRIIDQSDTPQVISNLDAPENRHIKDWYPDPDMKVDFPKAARGSGQVRMFGRIGLYKGENLHTTYRWLQQAAHDVSDPAAYEDFPSFNVDQNLQFVYIICSICGGTGSGMFLDVAYMLRKIVGVDPSTRRFVGMFVLPEVYEPVVENQHIKRIYANAYAALREVDYLTNSPKRSYQIRGKDHTFVDFQKDVTPFDFLFLFSNKNKRGAVISQRQVSGDKPVAADDRVSQYMSETIMTDVLSPLTERSESILSNIFTSMTEPEQVDDRTFYKSWSSVGVASVKVPSVGYFQDMLEARMTNAVVDFLLRPDPDVTEKALAKQFFADNLSQTEEALRLKASLSTDPSYGRYLSRPFIDEFHHNRPECVNKLKQWADAVMAAAPSADVPLEIEKQATTLLKQTLSKVSDAVSENLRRFTKDPERGYVFLREYTDELIALANNKIQQVPPAPEFDGDPKRGVAEALDSLQRGAKNALGLPAVRDTLETMLERTADFYDNHGRDIRSRSMVINFYNSLIQTFESFRAHLLNIASTGQGLQKECDEKLNTRIASMGDTSQERILIDKSLIGRKEVERFLNGLLAPLWEKADWKCASPILSAEMKKLITDELSGKLIETQLDKSLDADAKKEKLKKDIQTFVSTKIFDKLFPKDSSGMIKEPRYTDADGKTLLLDFSQDNLLSLMTTHSAPLWYVQTHQIGSASSPITFVGMNGTKIPEGVVDDLQEQIPNFRTTDIVLSDNEPRIVVKQYDPLYALASLAAIGDYENYYKNTDRRGNPMHTDVKFVSEPNPYLQWLSYKAPEHEILTVCARGHDITEARAENAQFCPICSNAGIKTLIVLHKMLCPKCGNIIDDHSRKCPDCAAILEGVEDRKSQAATVVMPKDGKEENLCPGCVSLGRKNPEVMVVKQDGSQGKSFCPSCGSSWANLCPYCSAPLEKLTMCTKGSDRCIFESPPILQCAHCTCPVTPDTTKCPRCFKELVECQECKKEGNPKRMIPKGEECPVRHKAPQPVAAQAASG